ncbi:hypothetical protein JL721_11757 [Aureococcus anophagefferens]|nr:hypothetical protein JL721_11757 [Aureococcus anophagefferens]
MATGEVVDTAFVDNFVESDAVLYMILQKDGGGSWEARRPASATSSARASGARAATARRIDVAEKREARSARAPAVSSSVNTVAAGCSSGARTPPLVDVATAHRADVAARSVTPAERLASQRVVVGGQRRRRGHAGAHVRGGQRAGEDGGPEAAAAAERAPPPPRGGSRPVINGLYAKLGHSERLATPPQKENRQTDDIFVAQAELRPSRPSTASSRTSSAASGRTQQMEIDRNAAVAECDGLRERERALREQVANARRDASKAAADAERCEEASRKARADEDAAVRDRDAAVNEERRGRGQREADAREIAALRKALDESRAALEAERRAVAKFDAESSELRDAAETANAECSRLREEAERLAEDVETEKEWREQAQKEAAAATERLGDAEAAAQKATTAASYLRRTSKLAIEEASAVRSQVTAVKKPANGRTADGDPDALSQGDGDLRRKYAAARDAAAMEKKRAEVLYHQLKHERDALDARDREVDALRAALDRARKAHKHELHRYSGVPCFLRDDDDDEIARAVQARYAPAGEPSPATPPPDVFGAADDAELEARAALMGRLGGDDAKDRGADVDDEIPMCFQDDSDDDFDFGPDD